LNNWLFRHLIDRAQENRPRPCFRALPYVSSCSFVAQHSFICDCLSNLCCSTRRVAMMPCAIPPQAMTLGRVPTPAHSLPNLRSLPDILCLLARLGAITFLRHSFSFEGACNLGRNCPAQWRTLKGGWGEGIDDEPMNQHLRPAE
jgi:hypothetical protein